MFTDMEWISYKNQVLKSFRYIAGICFKVVIKNNGGQGDLSPFTPSLK
jgi:hypothetical protein